MNTYATENNINTSLTQNLNLYENLLAFKEKNNSLQIKVQELSKVKTELDEKSKRLSELEGMFSNLKDENK